LSIGNVCQPDIRGGCAGEAITALIGVRINADPFVRHAVAHGLGITSRPDAIETPIELMADVADDVRDWLPLGWVSLLEIIRKYGMRFVGT
jgi:hypothetical protein